MTNYLVLEYKGAEYKRFIHLIKHYFKSQVIENYTLFEGKSSERIQVFIFVNRLKIEEADSQLKKISNALKTKMTKNWKYLPRITLPNTYNIVTLPYKNI